MGEENGDQFDEYIPDVDEDFYMQVKVLDSLISQTLEKLKRRTKHRIQKLKSFLKNLKQETDRDEDLIEWAENRLFHLQKRSGTADTINSSSRSTGANLEKHKVYTTSTDKSGTGVKIENIASRKLNETGELRRKIEIALGKGKEDLENGRAQLKKSKLRDYQESGEDDDDDFNSTNDEDSSDDEDFNSKHNFSSKRCSQNKLTSGLFRGSSNKVVKEVIWPMDKIGPQHTNYGQTVYHKDLDMRLLVLGELGIINTGIGKIERVARLELLKDIIFNAEHFEWNALLRLHAAILREIEMGKMKWGDSHMHMTQLILTPFPKSKYILDEMDDHSYSSTDKSDYEDD